MAQDIDIQIDERVVVSLEPPKLWKVLVLNDDQTPMEFVIDLLIGIFRHNEFDAKNLTLEIHETGSAVAGVYPHEIAEQRGVEGVKLARANGFPLQIQVEQE
jgi:ATP-dependent Clp protease adaptor protein ClpS